MVVKWPFQTVVSFLTEQTLCLKNVGWFYTTFPYSYAHGLHKLKENIIANDVSVLQMIEYIRSLFSTYSREAVKWDGSRHNGFKSIMCNYAY